MIPSHVRIMPLSSGPTLRLLHSNGETGETTVIAKECLIGLVG